jgi:hypothetical protein
LEVWDKFGPDIAKKCGDLELRMDLEGDLLGEGVAQE